MDYGDIVIYIGKKSFSGEQSQRVIVLRHFPAAQFVSPPGSFFSELVPVDFYIPIICSNWHFDCFAVKYSSNKLTMVFCYQNCSDLL